MPVERTQKSQSVAPKSQPIRVTKEKTIPQRNYTLPPKIQQDNLSLMNSKTRSYYLGQIGDLVQQPIDQQNQSILILQEQAQALPQNEQVVLDMILLGTLAESQHTKSNHTISQENLRKELNYWRELAGLAKRHGYTKQLVYAEKQIETLQQDLESLQK